MQMIPFRGYMIPALTIEEYRNLYELQSVVEPAVAALAAERASQEAMKEVESWAGYEYKLGQRNSYYTFLEWNRNFHIAIAAATRNQALLDVVRNVQTRLMRYYFLVIIMDSYGPELVEEHRDLVRALKAGNTALARTRASDHLVNTARRSMNVDLRAVHGDVEHHGGDDGEATDLASPVRGRVIKKREITARRPVSRRQTGVPPKIRLR
jgi:DNA-binding GntR family transcriptional regulator